MPNLSLAYLLAALGFFGVAGLNRFYLGKPVTGIVWFLTGGVFLIGSIYDMVTMERQVAEAAARRGVAPTLPRPALSPDPNVELELRLLHLARHHRGRLTSALAAAELLVPLGVAERKLDELTVHGHAEMEITEDGIVVYDFPALRLAG